MAYIASPIVLTLLVITIVSVIIGLRQAKSIRAEGEVESGSKRAPMTFLLVMIGFVCFALYNTATIPDYAFVDAIFPVTIATATLVCGLVLLVQMRLRPEQDALFADREAGTERADNRFALWPTLSWFAGLLVATALVGFILALAGFLLAFFRRRAGLGWGRSLLLSGIGILFMCFMAWLLNRDFPPGLLQEFFVLPWPFT